MLRHLSLRDFRNLERLELTLSDAGAAIVGENGQGKTNLLEAIAYLALLRSLRGAKDQEVIRFGAPAFHIRAELSAPTRVDTMSLGYERATRRKKAMLDAVEQPRLSDALGTVPSVGFSPADVSLVAGGPGERRHFLDVTLALSMPRYLSALQGYRGALRQRNAALREAQRQSGRTDRLHDARVSVWEAALIQHGAMLAASRMHWVHHHQSQFSSMCEAIGERLPVTMQYRSHVTGRDRPNAPGQPLQAISTSPSRETELAEAYTTSFQEHRTTEIRRGMTLVGPHRDDLQLLLGGRDLRITGSAGQQRTAAIALRLLEADTLRGALGTTPLLLLDDPFAELDARRCAGVLSLLQDAGTGQVVLAVPREEDIPRAFTRLDRRTMKDGVLQ